MGLRAAGLPVFGPWVWTGYGPETCGLGQAGPGPNIHGLGQAWARPGPSLGLNYSLWAWAGPGLKFFCGPGPGLDSNC